jgi:ribosomal protein S27E
MAVVDRTSSCKLGIQLQRDLSMAISEYAPDSQVVANGNLLTSRYIRKLPRMDWRMFNYVRCGHCQTLNIAPHTGISQERTLVDCRQCGRGLTDPIKTFLIPEFGFEADGNRIEKPGLIRPERTYRGGTAYVGYREQIAMRDYHIGSADIQLGISKMDEMAVLNESRFFVCETCGYAVLDESCFMNTKKAKHHNSGGFICMNDRLRHYSLGYCFLTDVVILRFITPDLCDRGTALSVMYGLLRGVCSELNIEENDVSGCLQYFINPVSQQDSLALVLFDRTPGGAGHVRRLDDKNVLECVLYTTRTLMSQCDCGGETADSSCYMCLRGYYNQKHHDVLKRGLVIGFLNQVFGNQ